MKKWILTIMTAFLLVSLTPMQVKAGTEIIPALVDTSGSAQSTEANNLIFRLNEIKEMNKSKLTSAEKKQLKQEVRSLKTRLKEVGGGIYLSAGAIIIIILLLILLL